MIVIKERLAGTTMSTYDNSSNDSDKTFTVPDNKLWIMDLVRASLKATSTNGTRQFRLQVYDTSSNMVYRGGRIPIVADETGGILLQPQMTHTSDSRNESFSAGGTTDTLPRYIPAGYDVRIWDSEAVDAAADDVTVTLLYQEVSV